MKKTLRTFVAVEISEPIRARAAELIAALNGTASEKGVRNRLCEASEGPFRQTVPDTFFAVKWVEPHNLHLTLKFLGEVHQREIARVCRAVEFGAAQLAPFQLDVRGAGAFPNVARPRTVWLGAGEDDEQMVRLHDRVEAALAELGYREEHRRFQAHLTIGRVRGGGPGIVELGSLLKEHADFSAGRMTVERVTVFASRLTPDGPIHEVLGSARLGG